MAILQQLLKPPGEASDDAHLEAALWAALPAGCRGSWQVHAQRAGSQVEATSQLPVILQVSRYLFVEQNLTTGHFPSFGRNPLGTHDLPRYFTMRL